MREIVTHVTMSFFHGVGTWEPNSFSISPRTRRSGASWAIYSMPVWAWILLVGGFVGMIGAALICVVVYECTTMKFRRWETLP
jgi:hypothetical protein